MSVPVVQIPTRIKAGVNIRYKCVLNKIFMGLKGFIQLVNFVGSFLCSRLRLSFMKKHANNGENTAKADPKNNVFRVERNRLKAGAMLIPNPNPPYRVFVYDECEF